jgi:uncharacterized membrane protein YkvA (DUF1232 family)
MEGAREYVEGKDAKERQENREKIMKRSRQWVKQRQNMVALWFSFTLFDW